MEWVSIRDQLPEHDTLVLAFEEGWIGTTQFYDGIFWDCSAVVPVTHWMPLPAPPDIGKPLEK